jgi:hypothetical protein
LAIENASKRLDLPKDLSDHALVIVTLGHAANEIRFVDKDRYKGPEISEKGVTMNINAVRSYHLVSTCSLLDKNDLGDEINDFIRDYDVRINPNTFEEISGAVYVAILGLGYVSTEDLTEKDSVTNMVDTLISVANVTHGKVMYLGHPEIPFGDNVRGKVLATFLSTMDKHKDQLRHSHVYGLDLFSPLSADQLREVTAESKQRMLAFTRPIMPVLRRLIVAIKLLYETAMQEDALMDADEEDVSEEHVDHELSLQDVKANMPPMNNEATK